MLDDKYFIGTIENTRSDNLIFGKITVQNGDIYLCQNKTSGNSCMDKKGYKFSYTILSGSVSDLFNNMVNIIVLKNVPKFNNINLKQIYEIEMEKVKENLCNKPLTFTFTSDTARKRDFLITNKSQITTYPENRKVDKKLFLKGNIFINQDIYPTSIMTKFGKINLCIKYDYENDTIALPNTRAFIEENVESPNLEQFLYQNSFSDIANLEIAFLGLYSITNKEFFNNLKLKHSDVHNTI
jgi:hypothetical protein